MAKFIVTFGFAGDDGEYQVQDSKPIEADTTEEAELMLLDQFHALEGQPCDIIKTT